MGEPRSQIKPNDLSAWDCAMILWGMFLGLFRKRREFGWHWCTPKCDKFGCKGGKEALISAKKYGSYWLRN